ncbi:hypothetical protein F4703DRAFT_1798669 [Phycomyces blakesleeanus]
MARKNGASARNQRRNRKQEQKKVQVETAPSHTASIAESNFDQADESTARSSNEESGAIKKEASTILSQPVEASPAISTPDQSPAEQPNVSHDATATVTEAEHESQAVQEPSTINNVSSVPETVAPESMVNQIKEAVIVSKNTTQGIVPESVACEKTELNKDESAFKTKQLLEIVAPETIAELSKEEVPAVIEYAPIVENAVESPADSKAVIAETSIINLPNVNTTAVEIPVVDIVSVKKTSADISAVEEPAIEEPSVEKPVFEELAVKKPAVEEFAVETPAIEEPAVEKPAVEKPAIEEPAIEEPAVEKPAVKEAIVEASSVNELVESAENSTKSIVIEAHTIVQSCEQTITENVQTTVAKTETAVKSIPAVTSDDCTEDASIKSTIVSESLIKKEFIASESPKITTQTTEKHVSSGKRESQVKDLIRKEKPLQKKKSILGKIFKKPKEESKTKEVTSEKEKKRKTWQFWK